MKDARTEQDTKESILKYNLIAANPFTPVYDTFGTPGPGVTNTENDPFIPEVWANESIAILVENLVAANLVHRDFENLIARFGDVINTRKPAEFTANRKTDYEDVTIQTPEATNVQVKLDQHYHVSFMIKDGEDSVAFKDLVGEYLEPAVIAIAQAVDKVILGQHAQFTTTNANVAGKLGLLSSSTAKDYILDTRKVLNDLKCPMTGRRFIVGSDAETSILKADDFTSAEKVGDSGTALREASIGFKLGFDFFMDQNMSEYTNTDTGTADDVDGAVPAGTTSLNMTDGSVVTVGDMITIAGDMTPQRIVTVSTNAITISPGLRYAVEDAAVITVYDSGLIDQDQTTLADGGTASVAGYRLGWHKGIVLDSIKTAPDVNVGQQIFISESASLSAAGNTYTIISVDSTGSATATVQLDRPLEAAVPDNAIVSLYPSGNYNFAFNRNAIAFVSRPLAMPRAGTGALAATVSYEGIGLRVCITYDGTRQGHLVTVDLLCGVKVLDKQYGAVMYG
ncbi:MAG: hypothetical protein DRH97_01715 [Chloroflexi bacterium]|nr:MAG: hypothetical protein DRH97_01715 [Chloroflexota bacterium]